MSCGNVESAASSFEIGGTSRDIAGGALAGVIYAFLNVNGSVRNWLTGREQWAKANNPAFAGDNSHLIAMIPFLLTAILLYLVGRGMLMAGRRGGTSVSRDFRT